MPQLTVAHDYICPWCWVGRRQAKRLRADFPTLTFDWKGYELLPEGLPYTPKPPEPNADKKPRVPSRFDLILAADELILPKRTNELSNSRLALEGAEFAAENGKAEEYHDAVYHAYWEEDRDISDRAVLTEIAGAVGLDIGEFNTALERRTYRDRVVEYDEPAYAAGVYNVPTWMFPNEWVAEQPYSVLVKLTAEFMQQSAGAKPAP